MTWFWLGRGDRIRTCDLVLPKRRAGLVQDKVFKLYLTFCLVLRSLSWQIKQYLSVICPQNI